MHACIYSNQCPSHPLQFLDFPLSLWAGDHCRDQEDAGTERHASSAVPAKGVKWTAWSEPWDPQAVGSRRRPKEGFAWYSDQNEWK